MNEYKFSHINCHLKYETNHYKLYDSNTREENQMKQKQMRFHDSNIRKLDSRPTQQNISMSCNIV